MLLSYSAITFTGDLSTVQTSGACSLVQIAGIGMLPAFSTLLIWIAIAALSAVLFTKISPSTISIYWHWLIKKKEKLQVNLHHLRSSKILTSVGCMLWRGYRLIRGKALLIFKLFTPFWKE